MTKKTASTTQISFQGFTRNKPTFNSVAWAALIGDVGRLHTYFTERPAREPFQAELVRADSDALHVRRLDAAPGSDADFRVPRVLATNHDFILTLTAKDKGCKVLLDEQPSSTFIRAILILMKLRFGAATDVLSNQDSPSWEAAAWAALHAAAPGPWVDKNVHPTRT